MAPVNYTSWDMLETTEHDGRLHCRACGYPLHERWRCRLVAEWRDLWIGAYWDRKRRLLYLLPMPCLGIVLNFGDNP